MDESIIIVGDLNRKIGNDDLGVRNNHPAISFGGELIRTLLADGKFVCLNNHQNATGGPWTRVDPAHPEIKSCLDLVIISLNLLPYFVSITIDSSRKFSPVRPVNKSESRHSDHFPIIVEFRNIPRRGSTKLNNKPQTVWNLNKDGGWDVFNKATKELCEFEDVFDNNNKSTTDIVKDMERKITKKKFEAFGKIKIRNNRENKDLNKLYDRKRSKLESNDVEKEISHKLLELQREEVEKEIKEVMLLKQSKGKSAAVFNTLKKICGSKKVGQEQVAMRGPNTNIVVFEPREIKKVSLQYCLDLLTKREIYNEHKDYFYIQDMIHVLRYGDKSKDDAELSLEDFEKRLKLLNTKCKEKYQFILKSGEGYQNCLYNLFSKVWQTENKPQQWRNSLIIQIYKGKGDQDDFNNQRNIHTKDPEPKFFEGIVVDKSKPMMTKHCSKFQIGGVPGHRPQEHLFSIKSVISLYKYLSIPLFLQLWDISKYFDKENLRDAMDTLHEAGVKGKLYRLWYILNKDTQIRVKASVGITETAATGENLAQGSIGVVL